MSNLKTTLLKDHEVDLIEVLGITHMRWLYRFKFPEVVARKLYRVHLEAGDALLASAYRKFDRTYIKKEFGFYNLGKAV